MMSSPLWFLAEAANSPPAWYQYGLFAVVGLVFYFILIRPQMKQQKEHRDFANTLKKGDKVITNGGIWGEIDTVDNQTVSLKLSEKTKIKINRSAIAGHQPKPPSPETTK